VSDPTDWHQALAHVTGMLVRGEERITSHELLTKHLAVPVTDRAARRLRRVMRRLGWRPRKLRFGNETRNGYCRNPGAAVPTIRQAPALISAPHTNERATIERPTTGNMADELAVVAELGLRNLWNILSAPIDHDDGPLLRAKNAAAQTALYAQLRADENRLRQQQSNDRLAKLVEIIAQEEKHLRGAMIDHSQVPPTADMNQKGERARRH
jgi:hypothetical protein